MSTPIHTLSTDAQPSQPSEPRKGIRALVIAGVVILGVLIALAVQSARTNSRVDRLQQSHSILQDKVIVLTAKNSQLTLEVQRVACTSSGGTWTGEACHAGGADYGDYRVAECQYTVRVIWEYKGVWHYDPITDTCVVDSRKMDIPSTIAPPPVTRPLADLCPEANKYCNDGITTIPPGQTVPTAPPTYAPPATLNQPAGGGPTPCPEGIFPEGHRCHQD